MLSHDVRTPLSTILNVAQLQSLRASTDVDQRYATMLRKATEGILALVNEVLQAERFEAAGTAPRLTLIDLRALVRDLVDQLRLNVTNTALVLTGTVSDEVPDFVTADGVRLGQVLTNLLANAIKFTAQGHVSLRVTEQASVADFTTLLFEVSDTGIGIASDRLTAIFEPFVQATADTESRYGGSGLGLAICQQLLHRMGSRLEVHSVVGGGSTFRFSLVLRFGRPEID